jgi:hypothetical protein
MEACTHEDTDMKTVLWEGFVLQKGIIRFQDQSIDIVVRGLGIFRSENDSVLPFVSSSSWRAARAEPGTERKK